ncbi:hypothetical protein AB0H86_03255 [Streptomyces sp. NPDC050997]|uniref:hypothetical protein n=1 Tax=Streptomyces sp. NPDC050997 TaxID=3155519 RepID=UPI00341F1E21
MAPTGTEPQQHKQRTPFFSRPGVRRALPFVVISAIALVFIFENRASTEIRLLIPLVTMPLWGALMIAWGLGLLACAVTVRRRRDRKHQKRR